MKKKIITLILCLACILSITACVDESETETKSETETVQESVEDNEEEETTEPIAEVEEVEEEEPEAPEYYDEIFLENISKALEARWKLVDENAENHVLSSRVEFEKYVNAEKEYLVDCRNELFEDKKLQQYAITYLNAIDSQAEALQYYDDTSEESMQKWVQLWSEEGSDVRGEVIVALYDDYGMNISPERVHSVSAMRNSIYIKKYGEDTFYEKCYADWDESVILTTNDEGYDVLSATITNPTSYDFEDMTISVSWYDADGNQIDVSSVLIDEWNAGADIDINVTRSTTGDSDGGISLLFE